ncbi:hypothetical protein M6D93_16310 [Jatrophihabitans telluris]|uniref:Uncharacterized protein n=1 Tax=Jatrophihabitans telluris TaxID=2038343 RepID=A0ABY4QW09_9ACTN|nr:hypothetical protein [Jatrophihabitans telluris]UQX87851.1 hypothetical protein M6D93_16310 [Jatrophihabitans telluris]
MTETPGTNPGGYDDPNAPAPSNQPPPPGSTPGYQPPPAPGSQPPPPAYQAPAPPGSTPSYQPPPAPSYQPPPPAYQAPPPPSYQPPAPAYQAPPAPSYQPPGADPSAAGQWDQPAPASSFGQQVGFDPANLQNFDPKTVNQLDWGIIAAGVLTMLFSFFGYYKYSFSGLGISESKTFSAWHGFFGWFAALVAFAAAVVLAAHLIAKLTLPFPVRLVVLGGFALALLCAILALFVVPGPSGFSTLGFSYNKGHGISYWISLLLLIAGTVLSYLRFTQTGGKLPTRA